MSLDAIRHTRLDGKKPALVYVVLGPHAPIHDDNTVVLVKDTARPEDLDWRPLIGIRLALIQTQARPALAQRVIQAANEAGADFVGTADPLGELSLIEADIRPQLRHAREVLCPL